MQTHASKNLLEKGVTIFVVGGPFIALGLAIYLLMWQGAGTWTDFWVAIVLYLLSAVGVTVGYHRMATHNSFEAVRWLKNFLLVSGSMACEGPVLKWAADHRKHHKHTDVYGDPHSPHLTGSGVRGTVRGWLHAHIGWLFLFKRESKKGYIRDLLEDKDVRRIDSLFLAWVLLSLFALPFLVGLTYKGSWSGALVTMLWAGPVRVFFVQHVTWSINSVCHLWGKRPFPSDKWTGFSTNNLLIVLPSLGESFHQNHHAFPRSSEHGLLPGQRWLDVSGRIIWLLERLGLVRKVYRVSDESIKKRLSEKSAFEPTVS
ncbi:MAG: acyl-CoA desaturase [Patescibacteria group bacterium]